MRVAIIPARGGSKRIPRKNIKNFLGYPIIAYSIKTALSSRCFDKIIVSTDDKDIARVAKEYGAEVPFIRPEELADDYTPTIPVIKHAIECLDKQGQSPSEVCCIYATAPFIKASTIREAYKQMKEELSDYCFSATSFSFPIQRAIKITKHNRVDMFQPEHIETRSQDLEESYHDAGQFYWGKADAFKQQKLFFSEVSTPYILPRHLVQDMDTLEDWKRAELMYQVLDKNDELK